MLYQYEQPGNYIWLCREKNVLFTHTIFMETRCTGKLLQGEICQSLIDSTTQPNMPVVAMAFNVPVSCV